MCGIFGALRMGDGRLTTGTLKAIARTAEKRGKHAFGLAWIDGNNRLHHFKSPGKVSEALILIDRLKDQDVKAVVGHTRHATHGSVEDSMNNHPHHSDGGLYVHNGQIPNWEELIKAHALLPLTECDSEVLGLMLQSMSGSLLRRWVRSINRCDLTRPLNVAGLWNRPNRAIIARRGNPLWWSRGRTGNLYFCSLKAGLPGKPEEVPDSTAYYFDLNSGKTSKRSLKPFVDTGIAIAGSNSMGEACKPTRRATYTGEQSIEVYQWLQSTLDDLTTDERHDLRIFMGMGEEQAFALYNLEEKSGNRVRTVVDGKVTPDDLKDFWAQQEWQEPIGTAELLND